MVEIRVQQPDVLPGSSAYNRALQPASVLPGLVRLRSRRRADVSLRQ